MAKRPSLLRARAPLYGRFLAIFGLLLGASGLFGSLNAAGRLFTRGARLALLATLLRRLLRCLRGLPSRHCCSVKGMPLKPTVDGLHGRFLELYGKAGEADAASMEEGVLGLQQKLVLEDGQTIAYWDVGPRDARTVILLCNGLGARIAGWTPFFDAMHGMWDKWSQCRIVIPEYRGQFASVPLVGEAISVERSAADLAAVAAALGLQQCSLLCWSTGVQVGLQLALDQPRLVRSMVLIQGTTGEALDCILQPLCKVPGMPSFLSFTLRLAPDLLLRNGWRRALHARMMRHTVALECFGRCALWFFGSDLIPATAVRYGQDMIQTDAHFSNYCGYAEALGCHRISARLPEIQAPALVVTGTPDFVTPARCSYDMAALLGGDAELFDDVSGSHYYLFEEPHKLARRVIAFMERAAFVGKDAPNAAAASGGEGTTMRSRK